MELQEALACPIISLHTPLTLDGDHTTYHLLNAQRINALAPDSLLINTSRGPVVDNQALLNRLAKKHDLRAVMDVWEGEPNISMALLSLVDLATPHIAGYSRDGKILGTRMVLSAFLNTFALHAPSDPSVLAELVSAELNTPSISISERGSEYSDLRRIVLQAYPIAADDNSLRGIESQAMVRGFDLLRKQYPIRPRVGPLPISKRR